MCISLYNIKIIKDARILLENSSYDLLGYILIMPDRIKSYFDFTELIILSANGENISSI